MKAHAQTVQGPFTAIRSGIVGYEIVDGNGCVAVWVVGRRNAEQLTALMNMAHQCGMFNGVDTKTKNPHAEKSLAQGQRTGSNVCSNQPANFSR